MKTFRVTFAKNKVFSCKEIDNTVLSGICHYEHNNGNLIYAIIKTKTEDNTLTIANFIIREAQEKASVSIFNGAVKCA